MKQTKPKKSYTSKDVTICQPINESNFFSRQLKKKSAPTLSKGSLTRQVGPHRVHTSDLDQIRRQTEGVLVNLTWCCQWYISHFHKTITNPQPNMLHLGARQPSKSETISKKMHPAKGCLRICPAQSMGIFVHQNLWTLLSKTAVDQSINSTLSLMATLLSQPLILNQYSSTKQVLHEIYYENFKLTNLDQKVTLTSSQSFFSQANSRSKVEHRLF